MTTYSFISDDFVHMLHLPIMPGYQNFSGSVPAVTFTNPYIKFLSVDIDYRRKMAYMYDEHYK